MTTLVAQNFDSFIFAQGEELKTNSLNIAKAFEKRHADVLRAIEKITTQASDLFSQRNFALADYLDEQGKPRPMYEITRDGFIMVVMSFTGAKAFAIKEAYINAFNLMHAKLFPKTQYGLKDQPKPINKLKPVITQKVYDCWLSMVEIYGNQLINEYGELPPDIWVEAIEELTPQQIKCGFEGIKKSRSPFMPRLPVFLAYCHEKDVVTAKHKEVELVEKKSILESKLLEPVERRELQKAARLDEPEKKVIAALSKAKSAEARENFAAFIGVMSENGLDEFLDILSHATPRAA